MCASISHPWNGGDDDDDGDGGGDDDTVSGLLWRLTELVHVKFKTVPGTEVINKHYILLSSLLCSAAAPPSPEINLGNVLVIPD